MHGWRPGWCAFAPTEKNRVNGSVFLFAMAWAEFGLYGELPAMNNMSECSYMELWCRQRANDDPGNSWRWLGQADRSRELGQRAR
jgi:hypothetical protein